MILLTGATGYIASHTWIELIQSGEQVIGIDNFSNSDPEVLIRLSKLCSSPIHFEEVDVRDSLKLDTVFKRYPISSVMHFAGLKSVSESVYLPLKYYQQNLSGLLNLLEKCQSYAVRNLVFSSSATVYNPLNPIPYKEEMPLSPMNPYGQTKLFSEKILRDFQQSNSSLKVAYLRYFNPAGAHISGLLGESPIGVPNNLMPYISKVALGLLPFLKIYGSDWPTPDGTGVRDYVHVTDLAHGHIKSLDYLINENVNELTLNLGCGYGYSVLDLLTTFERVNNISIPYRMVDRRPGDIAEYYADVSLAKEKIGWSARLGIEEICRDSWRWQKSNGK